MRGKQFIVFGNGMETRITPADAGKTQLRYICEVQSGGSPPRMRGKPAMSISVTRGVGITPADAGKTITTSNVLN